MSLLQRVLTCVERRDAAGRPVGEQASVHDLGDDVVPCPYGGPRSTQPMNRAALRQVSPHLATIEGQLAAASARAGATVAGAWAAVTAQTLPAELCCEPVPVPVAAAYKACVGFRQVLGALLLTHDLRGVPLAELGGHDDFAGLLHREGWLMGRRQVCAGSLEQIARLYTALAQPGQEAGPDPRPAAEATALVVAWLLERRRWGPIEESPLARLAQHRPGLEPSDVVRLLDEPREAFVAAIAAGVIPEAVEPWLGQLPCSAR